MGFFKNLFQKSYNVVKMLGLSKRQSDYSLMKLSSEVWAYVCAQYVSQAVASANFRLIGTTSSGQKSIRVPNTPLPNYKNISRKQVDSYSEILKHPFISLLNNPNPYQTRQEFLAETQIFIDTTGDCYWYIVLNGLGVPESLRILPTANVKLIIDPEGTLIGYRFQSGSRSYDLPLESVVHFRTPNVLNQYTGMGCLEAAAKSAMILESMADMELALNDNMAVPPMIVQYTEGTLKREDRIRLEHEWNAASAGIKNAGKVKIADNQFDIKTPGLSPREMQFLQGRKWLREELCAAYRVPISLVTSESVNRANAEAGIYQFAKFGIEPRLELIVQTLNKELIPLYKEPRIFVDFESPIPEDKDFELRKFQAISSSGIFTDDELRERIDRI